jgi:hypothetical protein
MSDMNTEVIYERDGYIRNPKAGKAAREFSPQRITVSIASPHWFLSKILNLDTDFTDYTD